MLRTLHSCVSPAGHFCDGVAVISDIMALPEPQGLKLQAPARRLVQTYRAWEVATPGGCFISSLLTPKAIAIAAAELVDTVRRVRPLVHQVDRYHAILSPFFFFFHGLCVCGLILFSY